MGDTMPTLHQNTLPVLARKRIAKLRKPGMCYRATVHGEKPWFSSESCFLAFCEANRKQRMSGLPHEDCRGCRVKGVADNVIIGRVAA